MLHSACKKRKDILPKTVQFIIGVITSNDATSSQKDGALYMVSTIFFYFSSLKLFKYFVLIVIIL